MRIGVGRALRGAVTAQLLLAITDVGKILSDSGAAFDMPTLNRHNRVPHHSGSDLDEASRGCRATYPRLGPDTPHDDRRQRV